MSRYHPGADSAFAACHPAVTCSYFLSVLLFTMFSLQPICLAVSLIAAAACAVRLNGKRALGFNPLYLLPLLVCCALLNPLFNHGGVTALFSLNGNSVTLEAVLYGLASAVMLAAAVCWFACYSAVVSSDKFIYLFGRLLPGLSLLLSLTLSLVPRFARQARLISRAQRGLRPETRRSLWARTRQGERVASILITWALEHAVDTADSMKARGFGLPGRSSYALYRFTSRDGGLLALIVALSAYTLCGLLCGALDFRYLPDLRLAAPTFFAYSVYLVYAALCFLPLLIERAEDNRWHHLASKN